MDCTIYVVKTKALILVTTKLICVFVSAYSKSRFSFNAAHIVKLGFTRVYIFLIFALKHRLLVLVRTASLCFEQK